MMEDKKAPDQKPTSGADTTLLHQSPPDKEQYPSVSPALEATFVGTSLCTNGLNEKEVPS